MLLMLVWGSGTQADYTKGLAAYRQGDYAAARKLWHESGRSGDALSQYGMGVLYRHGQGVEKDWITAAKWMRRAARQGLADAQFELGAMLALGDAGLDQDTLEAYFWLSLAAGRGDLEAVQHRDFIASLLSPKETEQAKKRIDEWQQKQR